MSVRKLKPNTPGQRGMTTRDFSAITTDKPVKSLLISRKEKAGRNNNGRITTRHKGAGVKRHIRIVNFSLPAGTKAEVEAIEYDPGRSANIARIKDQEGQYHYIVAPAKLKVGATIQSGADSPITTGNRLPMKNMPTGAVIHAVELKIGKGAVAVRSAGNSAQLVSKEGDYVQVRMPSGEVRKVRGECMASIGSIGNEQHQNVVYGKAGRKRKMGIRPTVRGVAMNAVDHPHGGGDGGAANIGGGLNHGTAPRSPWGQKTIGYKTRSRRKSNKLIVRSRHEGKRK